MSKYRITSRICSINTTFLPRFYLLTFKTSMIEILVIIFSISISKKKNLRVSVVLTVIFFYFNFLILEVTFTLMITSAFYLPNIPNYDVHTEISVLDWPELSNLVELCYSPKGQSVSHSEVHET